MQDVHLWHLHLIIHIFANCVYLQINISMRISCDVYLHPHQHPDLQCQANLQITHHAMATVAAKALRKGAHSARGKHIATRDIELPDPQQKHASMTLSD
jgi:hypothetical protein